MPLAYSRCLINGTVSPILASKVTSGKMGSSSTLPPIRTGENYMCLACFLQL